MATREVLRLRVALGIGAAIWLSLLLAGFFAPGGWTWGMPGPVGHMENYSDAPPWLAAILSVGLLLWARRRSRADGIALAAPMWR
jgi:ABC-type branched-subunit amino acid transport system permease subunit